MYTITRGMLEASAAVFRWPEERDAEGKGLFNCC